MSFRARLESPLLRWLNRWHGQGAAHQFQFYRCQACESLVTHRHIKTGGCRCGGGKISPAYPTLHERLQLLFMPWRLYAR